jgi:hypothetical protein
MRVPGTLLLVLLASAGRAGEPAPAPADSIAAAKRDLAAIKSAAAQPDAAALPTMDMKDLGPVPGGVRPEAEPLPSLDRDLPQDPAKKKVGTGNWLVDAMDRNPSARSPRSNEKDDVLRGDPGLIGADERGVRTERDPFAAEVPRDGERIREPLEAVYNPLDSFMSGWVSARDHDLLLSAAKGDGGADGGKMRADLLPGLEVAPPGPAADFTLAPVDSSAFGNPRQEANPYLAASELMPAAPMKSFVEPDVPGFGPTQFQDGPRDIFSSGVDARPIDTSRGLIPDFALPPDDDKYFRQLKKF